MKVPVQVVPPSALVSAPTEPPCTVRSVLVKPVTASEKLSVKVAVSPDLTKVFESDRAAVGNLVSTVKLALVAAVPALPAKSV